jgi:hypothetical protein
VPCGSYEDSPRLLCPATGDTLAVVAFHR